MVMRPISREVQRGFLADLGGLVSVILASPPSATGCINSPGERGEGEDRRATEWTKIKKENKTDPKNAFVHVDDIQLKYI